MTRFFCYNGVGDYMSKRIKKMTWDEFTAAAKSGAIAAGVILAVLGPEKHSPISVLKKPVAKAVRFVYNKIIPDAFRVGSDLVDKSGMEQLFRNKLVDFLYDELSKYNGTFLMEKAMEMIPTDRHRWTKTVDSYIRSILNKQDNRKQVSEELAGEIMDVLRKLLDGSKISLRFNAEIEKTIETAISGAIETILTTPVANSTTNMILDSTKKLDDFNVGGLLEKIFGLDKQGMSDYIDSVFSKYVGEEMLENLEKDNRGDVLADQILNVEPGEIRETIKNEYMNDVVDLVWRASTAGIVLRRLFHKKK